jgi:predicted transcriptional regulator
MTVKEAAKHVIDALPEGATIDDIIHALYIKAKCERGEREIRAGRGIPHKTAMKRLQKWVR